MDKFGYQLNNEGLRDKAPGNRYYKSDIELMTTHQLREICRKERIIQGIVNPLDKEELVRTILRYRGAQENLLIRQNRQEGWEALQRMLQRADIQFRTDCTLECSAKITVYRGRGIHYYDNICMKYEPSIVGTNALVVSEDRKLCGILNIETKGNDQSTLYLTKGRDVLSEESEVRNYELFCMDRRTSELLYRIYQGEIEVLPEKLAFYRVRLLDFTVRDPVELSMPLAVDFGSTNTTAGIYMDDLYFVGLGIQPEQQMRWHLNKMNHAVFYDVEQEYAETPLLPSVAALRVLNEGGEPEFIFGYEALRELDANYADEGFCVSFDIKSWLMKLDKKEEFVDRKGARTFISRKQVLQRYFRYVIQNAEDCFKCKAKQVHISCPMKQRYLFQQLFQEVLTEYDVDAKDMLDEGVSVLYGTIDELLKKKKIHMKEKYKALIIDCGGSTTDMTSCTFSVLNQRMSYKIDIDTTYMDGDMDFGGNSITYRIMQVLKIQLFSVLEGGVERREASMDDLMERFEVDVYRYVDENGTKKLYAPMEALYAIAEKKIPTRFQEWENLSRSDYYRVKNNYFFLFRLAEQIKNRLYNKERLLSVRLSAQPAPKTIVIDKWKINVMGPDGLQALRDFPDLEINIFDINQVLKADIYSIIKRFIEPMYKAGEVDEYALVKLCGQSCKIDIFRDAVNEFVPGQMVEFKRKKGDLSQDFELKMTCLNGAMRYLHDKKYGFADVHINSHFLQIPYTVVGYTHTGQEVVVLDGANWKNKHGSISRNMDDLTLQLYLKDSQGDIRCNFNYYCTLEAFQPKKYEEIGKLYGTKIPQDDTDVIVDREVKFFVWAEPLKWGFSVVPVYRRGEELLLGPQKFFYFENDSWVKNFFDGTK